VWRFEAPRLVCSTAIVGGGIGLRSWVLDVEVPSGYDRVDVDAHVGEVAAAAGCTGDGVGLLTAAPVDRWVAASDGGVDVVATVGVTRPTWAADTEAAHAEWAPGTINVVAFVPVRLSDPALVNAATTATEAKAQALVEGGVTGTGTASDAVCVVCPPGGPVEPFGGPRSVWGARLARAVHRTVVDGL
jgi:adenosylcobinamide hydrolase